MCKIETQRENIERAVRIMKTTLGFTYQREALQVLAGDIDTYVAMANDEINQLNYKVSEQKRALDVLSARISPPDPKFSYDPIHFGIQALIKNLRADNERLKEENSVLLKEKQVNSAAETEFCSEKSREWDGQGPPPVGSVCDWREVSGSQWVEAEVLFISDTSVVLKRSDGFEWQMRTNMTKFRPLPTPAQAAAEEREGELNRMVATVSMLDKGWARKVCAGLYDAGYRKHEQS